jgi:hypothetical protein
LRSLSSFPLAYAVTAVITLRGLRMAVHHGNPHGLRLQGQPAAGNCKNGGCANLLIAIAHQKALDQCPRVELIRLPLAT